MLILQQNYGCKILALQNMFTDRRATILEQNNYTCIYCAQKTYSQLRIYFPTCPKERC
jgi:hypothetical protein